MRKTLHFEDSILNAKGRSTYLHFWTLPLQASTAAFHVCSVFVVWMCSLVHGYNCCNLENSIELQVSRFVEGFRVSLEVCSKFVVRKLISQFLVLVQESNGDHLEIQQNTSPTQPITLSLNGLFPFNQLNHDICRNKFSIFTL